MDRKCIRCGSDMISNVKDREGKEQKIYITDEDDDDIKVWYPAYETTNHNDVTLNVALCPSCGEISTYIENVKEFLSDNAINAGYEEQIKWRQSQIEQITKKWYQRPEGKKVIINVVLMVLLFAAFAAAFTLSGSSIHFSVKV